MQPLTLNFTVISAICFLDFPVTSSELWKKSMQIGLTCSFLARTMCEMRPVSGLVITESGDMNGRNSHFSCLEIIEA